MTKIDDVCHLDHLKLLSKEMVKWEMIAVALGLSEANMETIRRNNPYDYEFQKCSMLYKWKNINGNATYKVLADVFFKLGEVGLRERLYTIINEPILPENVPLKNAPVHGVLKFRDHLKLRYKNPINRDQWPHPPSQIYINLALIKQQNVRLNKIDDYYTRSTIHYSPDDVLKEKIPIDLKDIFDFKEGENKCILIEAGPGLGKTTLSFKICKDWADDSLLKGYDIVILLQLRLLKLQTAEKIIDLLVMIEDDAFKKDVAKEICENDGNKVCFIVEGFDELPLNLQRNSIFTQISEKLPHAMIIYTSRPVAISHLIGLINKRIEIIGFKSEQVQQYIETTLVHLHKGEEDYEAIGKNKAIELMKMLKSNLFFEKLIYIPIYVAIITYLFDTKNSLPATCTKLYYLLVQNIILRHLRVKKCDGSTYLKSLDSLPETEDKHFSNICHLAFKGLENNEITFNTTNHLHDYGIPENINGLGLLCIAPMLCDCGTIKSLNFMHLNFQEFCAAFYISNLSKHEQYEIFGRHQDNPTFQVCWQFYAGLTKLKYQQILTSMIPKSDMQSSVCKYDLIQLLLCLYEAESSDLCKQVIKFMNGNIDLSGYEMNLLNCSSLSYFIENSTPGSIKDLRLKWCGIRDKGLQCICKAFISSYESNSHISCCHDLVSLDFSYNDLTEQGAGYIAKLLSSSYSIESLNCGGNYKLGDDGIKIIVDSLLNNCVKILKLRKTGLTLKGIQAISKVLHSNTNLTVLDISENNLDFKMLTCMSESLAINNTLTTLLLKWCKLGVEEAKVLSSIINSNRTLNTLDLGYNEFRDSAIACIVEAIKSSQTLQTLNLNVSGITCADAYCVADLISANLHHMTSLYIGGNFGEQGLEAICEGIKKNSSLSVVDLTPNSMSVSARPLSFLINVLNNTNIKSLHIVPPCNCSVLLEAIEFNTTLQELKLSIKETNGFTLLTQSIAKNKTITKLEFLFTKMDKQWSKDIVDMLQVKTNFISLAINGEVYAEDCMLLCKNLLKCVSLQTLSFTAYQKMIPSTAYKFLSSLEALNLLEKIVLNLNSHYAEKSESSEQKSSGIALLKLIPMDNMLIFRQIERLLSSINERRHSAGSPELQLYIQEN